jgi:putative salt-induced outer membrane protein
MPVRAKGGYMWKNPATALLLAFLAACPAWGANTPAGYHHESEAGIVITSGNADSQSYNFKQTTTYGWDVNLLKLTAKYLSTRADGVETARSWALGLRYERELADRFSAFAGESVESDIFAGILQKYNTDVGGKYFLIKEDGFEWLAEAGYRLAKENQFGGQVTQHYLRIYTEATRNLTKTFAIKASVEYLPNLTVGSDFQLNAELAANAAISEVFAVKLGYTRRYRKIPVAPATESTDSQFTTALVAKL